MTTDTQDKPPRLRPTPLTWLYVLFAVAIVALTAWGLWTAASP